MDEATFKQNIVHVLKKVIVHSGRLTEVSKSLGYTSTSQLHSISQGDSLISTKAILNLIDKHQVNPLYLFLGKGEMFLTEENELDTLREKVEELTKNNEAALKTIMELNEIIKKLEKRNADLIDITSAAIKYHQGQKSDEIKSIEEVK